jgi:hypothetical protein
MVAPTAILASHVLSAHEARRGPALTHEPTLLGTSFDHHIQPNGFGGCCRSAAPWSPICNFQAHSFRSHQCGPMTFPPAARPCRRETGRSHATGHKIRCRVRRNAQTWGWPASCIDPSLMPSSAAADVSVLWAHHGAISTKNGAEPASAASRMARLHPKRRTAALTIAVNGHLSPLTDFRAFRKNKR